MLRSRLLGAGLLVAGFALVPIALAQPRGRGRPAPKPKPSASADNPYDANGAAAAASASASVTTGTGGGGVVAPPPGDAGPIAPPPMASGGGALSPLNPAPNEFSDGGMPPMAIDYDRLLADVAALRARVAAVSDTLFHSRIAVTIETSGDHGKISGLTVSLDDGVVWTAPPSFRADDATTIYEHSVAPGHHAVTIEAERHDDRDDTYRSVQRSRFVVDVPTDQRLAVALKIWDDSSIGDDFKSDHKGQYELRVRMRVQAQAIGK